MQQHIPISALPRGTSFTRACKALGLTGGLYDEAAAIAGQWRDTPAAAEYLRVLKTAVSAGTSTDSAWAGPLVHSVAVAEFAELLRAGTIAGKMSGLRRVPLNVRYARQTAGSSMAWVTEGQHIPVSKMQFEAHSLGIAKAAGIVVTTQELIKNSSVDADSLLRADLLAGCTAFLDQQFIGTGYDGSSGSPAAITAGITATQSTGSTAALIAADLATLATTLADANETDSLFWIMTRSDAVRLAAKRDAQGGPAFPGVTATGGVLMGIPVIASNAVPHSTSAGSIVVLVNASGIDYGDLGAIEIEIADQGALQMVDGGLTSSAGSAVSLFQTNSVAYKITAYRNWRRRRDAALAILDNCHW